MGFNFLVCCTTWYNVVFFFQHTIQHYTGFCPTLLKFQCGQHEQYSTNLEGSLWIDDGFGMMAMYKSDWTKVGG